MPKSNWERLFTKALGLIKACPLRDHPWTFGGGTVLSLRYGHRISYDVDIFFADAQILPVISPRLNHRVMSLTPSYQEGANFVKLQFPEGEIDFILAPCLTDTCYTLQRICGERVRVETSGEIIAKKFFFRAETLRTRDIVDVAVVFKREPGSVLRVARNFLNVDAVERRWRKIKKVFHEEAREIAFLIPELESKTPMLFDAFLAEARKQAKCL